MTTILFYLGYDAISIVATLIVLGFIGYFINWLMGIK